MTAAKTVRSCCPLRPHPRKRSAGDEQRALSAVMARAVSVIPKPIAANKFIDNKQSRQRDDCASGEDHA
jgi:hypothetical protein